MTQPRAYYEGRLYELSMTIKEKRPWPWRCSGLQSRAITSRYTTFKGYQEHYEKSAKVFQATLDQGTTDPIIPILVHKEAGRASAYAFICELLRDYVDGFKDDDLKWSNGLTEHQLKVLVARVEQDINRCQLLLLGEEP